MITTNFNITGRFPDNRKIVAIDSRSTEGTEKKMMKIDCAKTLLKCEELF